MTKDTQSSMSQDLMIREKMKKLANLLLTPIDESTEERSKHGMRAIHLEEPKPMMLANNTHLVLIGIRNTVFTEIRNLLIDVPEVEHLKVNEIEDNLVKFVLSVLDGENSGQNLEIKIDTALNNLHKPLEDWNIIAPLDRMHSEFEITIGSHFIKKITLNDYEKYFFVGTSFKKNFDEYFLNKTCISVIVSSNNKDTALTKAKEVICNILSALRTFFGDHHFFHILEPYKFAVVHKTNRAGNFASFTKDKPECVITNEYQNSLPYFVSLVNEFLNSTPTNEIGYKIITAMRWFGNAVEEKNPEDKLTKYIISLETLLLTNDDRKLKGAALSYRVAAIQAHHQKGISDPNETLWLYKQRNSVVHEGYSRVQLTENDLDTIEYLTKNIIMYICKDVKENSILNTKDLILWIERKNDKPDWTDPQKFLINNCVEELQKYAKKLSKNVKS